MPLFTKEVSNKKSDGDSAKSVCGGSLQKQLWKQIRNAVNQWGLKRCSVHPCPTSVFPILRNTEHVRNAETADDNISFLQSREIEAECNITSALGKWVILLINALTFVSPSCSFLHHFITRLIWNSCETNTISPWREENKIAYLTWLYNTLLCMPKMRSFWLIYLSGVQLEQDM